MASDINAFLAEMGLDGLASSPIFAKSRATLLSSDGFWAAAGREEKSEENYRRKTHSEKGWNFWNHDRDVIRKVL